MEVYTMPKLDFNNIKAGHFIQFKSSGGFFQNRVVKEQLQEGFTPYQSEFTHIGVSTGGTYMIDASFPRVREVDIRKKYAGRYIRVVSYQNYTGNDRFHVAIFAATLNNLKYGWSPLSFWMLKDYFPLDKNFLVKYSEKFGVKYPKAPFCSLLSGHALFRQVPDAQQVLNKKKEELMPAHWGLPCFNLIYEGYI